MTVINDATSGIGLELTKLAAADSYALLLAADRPFERALLNQPTAAVETITVDLATAKGVAPLVAQVVEREVNVLRANPRQGLSPASYIKISQSCDGIGIEVVATLGLVQQSRHSVRARGEGGVLLTASLAGLLPGA